MERIHEAELPSTAFEALELKSRGWNNGMWVAIGGMVGILTGLREGVASVMLTDDGGFNLAPVLIDANTLRKAFLDEIPVPRRPDAQRAQALGYYKRTH